VVLLAVSASSFGVAVPEWAMISLSFASRSSNAAKPIDRDRGHAPQDGLEGALVLHLIVEVGHRSLFARRRLSAERFVGGRLLGIGISKNSRFKAIAAASRSGEG
jgi:hypothetical protein